MAIIGSAWGAEAMNVTDAQLFAAVRAGNVERVKAAIDAGANLTAENKDGVTALELAINLGHSAIAKFLYDRPDAPDPFRADRRRRQADPFDPANPVSDIFQASAPPPFTPSILTDTPIVNAPPPPPAVEEEKLSAPPADDTQDRASRQSRPPLKGTDLTIGRDLRLGAVRDLPADPNADKPADCIFKQHARIAFCVESVSWPAALSGKMTVSSVLYRGIKAIVRYDGGTASHIQTLFPSDSFDALVRHYTTAYGPPTDAWERSLRLLEQPAKRSRVRAWLSENGRGETTELRVLEFDDTRGGFADLKHGAVVIGANDDREIFPLLSPFDLMLMD